MNRDFLIPMNYINVVPGFEVCGDVRMRFFVGSPQIVERLARKDYAPTKSIVRSVPFVDGDVVFGISCFHEDGEVHAGRAAADDVDFHARNSSSAAPKRRTPSLNNCGSAHMPMRKCLGDSKKRPGTTAVSYFSVNKAQRFSTRPFSKRGNDVVPDSVRTALRSSRDSRNSLSMARLPSRIRLARATNFGNFESATTLSLSAGCGANAPKMSCSKRMRCANSGSARIQPQR